MGNLKNRDLHGHEILSQVSAADEEAGEMEQGEEHDGDDDEDEVGANVLRWNRSVGLRSNEEENAWDRMSVTLVRSQTRMRSRRL